MKKATKLIIAFMFVALVAVGAMVLVSGRSEDSDKTQATNEIIYNDSGFSPSQIKVAAGDSVTITNRSTAEIEPSSNPHPVHTDNPELNLGDIGPGKSKTFTITKTGTWGYHNHYNRSFGGTIVVE